MKLLHIIIATLMIGMLSSCFSVMKVRVDVYDYYAMKQSREYKFIQAQSLKKELNARLNSDYLEAIKQAIITQSDQAFKKYTKISPENQLRAWTNILKSIDTAINGYKAGIVTAKELLDTNPTENFDTSSAVYSGAQLNLNGYYKTLAGELDITEEDIPIFTEQVTRSVNEIKHSYGISVIDDPVASLVVKSPEKYWNKYTEDTDIKYAESDIEDKRNRSSARINETIARTFLGNSDIAVKMDSPGNFVVKGARVDSDEALKTSFKVLNQGIKYLAYASGVPVSNITGADEKEGSAGVKIPELVENDRLKRQINNVTNRSETYTEAFMKVLIIELENLEKNDTSAVERIKKSYETYKALIPSK